MVTILEANDDDEMLLDLFWAVPFADQAHILRYMVLAVVQHLRDTRPMAWGNLATQSPTFITNDLAKRCMPSITLDWPDFMAEALARNVLKALDEKGLLVTVIAPLEGGYTHAVHLADIVNREIFGTSVQLEHELDHWERDNCDGDHDETLPAVTPKQMQELLADWRQSLMMNLMRLMSRGSLNS